MAFTPLDTADIEVGKPVKKKLFTQTKDNFDDLNSRIGALETGAAKVDVFITEVTNLQQYVNGTELERIMLFRASRDLRIINAQIYVLSSSTGTLPTGGILEFDLRTGSDISSLSTVFSVRPTITGLTEGSTNGTLNFITNGELVSQGDWIALDITNLQTGQSRIFIDIYAEPSA